jgi:hypothetical protein
MDFVAGSLKPKATLTIEGVKYEIKTPSVGQSTRLVESLEDKTLTPLAQSKMMREFLCELGNIPMEALLKIESELFNQVFDHVIGSKKN